MVDRKLGVCPIYFLTTRGKSEGHSSSIAQARGATASSLDRKKGT